MLPQTRPYAKLEYEREKEKRRENLRRQIDSFSHQSLKAGVPSSCILNSLWFARNRLNEMAGKSQIGASRNGFELIIISDMLEECDDSPIGRISLNKRDTSKEIALASSMPAGPIAPNFSDVRITIIFPLADNLAFNPRRTASYYDLKEFWRLIFRHCGIREEWFWDSDHIRWISNGELPDRLKH